jgi:hypothetical protein
MLCFSQTILYNPFFLPFLMGFVARYLNGQIYSWFQLCPYIDIDNISTKIKINNSGRHYLHFCSQKTLKKHKIPSSWSLHLPIIFWDNLEIELHILWYILYWHTLFIYYLLLPFVFVVQMDHCLVLCVVFWLRTGKKNNGQLKYIMNGLKIAKR